MFRRFGERADNKPGIKRSVRRTSEFLYGMAARTLAWCAFGERARERRTHFRNMPAKSRFFFLLAVAFTFGTMGVVNDLFSLETTSGIRLLVFILFSSIFSVGWAYFGSRIMVKSMVALFVAQIGASIFIAKIVPSVHQTLSASQWQSAVAVRGALIQGFVIGGYVLFFTFFSAEGKRFFAALTEIELASTIQRSLVPPLTLQLPGMEVYGVSLPSGAVGGDLHDVVHHPDGTLAYVADVSGHGVKAGVLMSMIKSSVRTRFATLPPCADGFLDGLNEVLYPLTDAQSYATMVFLLFRPGGTVQFSLAGHLPVFHFRCATGAVEQRRVENLPVAMFPATSFTVESLAATPGDLIALVTDGLTEVFDKQGNELGSGYIEQTLRQQARAPLALVANQILEQSRNFGPVTDDRTLILIRLS